MVDETDGKWGVWQVTNPSLYGNVGDKVDSMYGCTQGDASMSLNGERPWLT